MEKRWKEFDLWRSHRIFFESKQVIFLKIEKRILFDVEVKIVLRRCITLYPSSFEGISFEELCFVMV